MPSKPLGGLQTLTNALKKLRPWPTEDYDILSQLIKAGQAHPSTLAVLQDELSTYLDPETGQDHAVRRSSIELMCVRYINAGDIMRAFDGFEAFEALLLTIHHRLGFKSEFRDCPVGSRIDRYQRRVIFTEPSLVGPEMRKAWFWARDIWRERPLDAAVAILVMLQAIHPFRDGNGRTVRILFNAMLGTYTGTSVYLPLYEAGLLSNGGWFLALRRAQQQDDWNRIGHYLGAVALLCIAAQANDA